MSVINYFHGCYQDGRRLALFGGTVTLRLHRNPQGNLGKEGMCYADYGRSDSGAGIMRYLLRDWIYDRISSWKDTEIAAPSGKLCGYFSQS